MMHTLSNCKLLKLLCNFALDTVKYDFYDLVYSYISLFQPDIKGGLNLSVPISLVKSNGKTIIQW